MFGSKRVRGIITPVVAIAMCAAVGLATRLPSVSGAERRDLVSRFSFEPGVLSASVQGARTLREVQPRLHRIRSWISSVGASVGLADFDGDGLPNERCLVDTRDDSVTIAPTPEAPARFASFPLLPSGLPYDARMTAPMGCVPADLNEDGHIDLIVYFWGRSGVVYLKRPGRPLGPDAFHAAELVAPQEVWNTDTLNVADLDGDGHLDIIVGNYFPDGARVLDPAATDDPLMEMHDSMSNAGNGGRNRLLRFTGLTTGSPDQPAAPLFADASSALNDRQARSWTLATGAQDLDGDGLPELYFANDFGPDHLLHNRSTPGQIRFRQLRGPRDALTPKSKQLSNDSFKGMGVTFSDLNADGMPDIFVSNITTEYALLESNFAFLSKGRPTDMRRGVAPYRDESERLGISRSGWGWDIKAGDFDNDGRTEFVQALGFLRGSTNRWAELQEVAMGNDELLRRLGAWHYFRPGDDLSGHEQNPFYVMSRSGRFTDIGRDLGLRNPGPSRGIALGDVDGDGRTDMAVANQWAQSTFFRNTSPARPFVGLRLVYPAKPGGVPRPAVGASVGLVRPDGSRLTGQLYPANGHTGVNAPELLFGLGPNSGQSTATITWRDSGVLHTMTVQIGPGWHTVVLGRPT